MDRGEQMPKLKHKTPFSGSRHKRWQIRCRRLGLRRRRSPRSGRSLRSAIRGWGCTGSIYCCNGTITGYFEVYQFENLFSKRNSPIAHAIGFWDYQSFIALAAVYEPLGFGTTGDKETKMREVAAFLGHVGIHTSCKAQRSFLDVNNSILPLVSANFLFICILDLTIASVCMYKKSRTIGFGR
ncbi:basic endochitinase A-like [Zingiber officinale]|uniref:basic endochitinase A-like n=1 Tax=Zingiber officinale TaxID=94328 RepID=UPI001C4B78B9|nr:basic endochitinase A-like [Zingiber officinale]